MDALDARSGKHRGCQGTAPATSKRLEELKNDVEGNPQVSERLDEVNELLNNFQPMPEKLKYAKMDEGSP